MLAFSEEAGDLLAWLVSVDMNHHIISCHVTSYPFISLHHPEAIFLGQSATFKQQVDADVCVCSLYLSRVQSELERFKENIKHRYISNLIYIIYYVYNNTSFVS